jgi:hypothetical protein
MDFIGGISGPSIAILSIAGMFKILFLVLVLGYILYNIFLALRVRILHDTVKNKAESMTPIFSYLNLMITFIGGFLVVILILVG